MAVHIILSISVTLVLYRRLERLFGNAGIWHRITTTANSLMCVCARVESTKSDIQHETWPCPSKCHTAKHSSYAKSNKSGDLIYLFALYARFSERVRWVVVLSVAASVAVVAAVAFQTLVAF